MRRRRRRPGGGRVQVTFVWTLSNFCTFHDRRQFTRVREQITEGTYLEHPETYWGQQIPSLDTRGAGAVDSRAAVGSSGRRGRVEISK